MDAPEKTKKSPLEKLAASIIDLTPEDREALSAKLGVELPSIFDEMDAADLDAPRVWGYRCNQCNRAALEFVGSARPYTVPPMRLSWVQPDAPAGWKTDRHHPNCQHCSHPIKLTGSIGNVTIDDGYVGDLDAIKQAIQRTQEACKEVRRSVDRSSSAYKGRRPSGGNPLDRTGGYPDQAVKEQLQAIAEAVGAGNPRILERELPVATGALP